MNKEPPDLPHFHELQYASPEADRPRLPGFRRAIILSVPATMAWFSYFSFHFDLPLPQILYIFEVIVFYPLIGMGIICAITSTAIFVRFRRNQYPWYVCYCLFVNVSGTVFLMWHRNQL